MNTNLKRALVAAGAAVLVAVLVVGVASGFSEQDRIDQARRDDAMQRAILRTTRALSADQRQALEAAYVAGTKLTEQIANETVDISLTTNELALATAALERARTVLAESTGRRDFVEACLSGVRKALDLSRVRDTAGATAFLRGAAPACEAALTPAGEAPPALAYDFPDPFVLRSGSEYFAYATNAAAGAVQTAHSGDLTRWELTGDALTALPAWASPGATWAPAAIQRGGETLLYYTVRQRTPNRLCITVASSGSPGGPFLDGSSAPLECGTSGAIDPSPFTDASGKHYLLYKTEQPARIWSRPLAPDGRSFAGPAKLMLEPTQGWQRGVVEAPSMLRRGSEYWMFFSGNDWNGRSYAQGVARCDGPEGPCRAYSANPILASRGRAVGPGGGEVFTDTGGGWRLAYHSYQEPLVKYPNSRVFRIARINFAADGTPRINP